MKAGSLAGAAALELLQPLDDAMIRRCTQAVRAGHDEDRSRETHGRASP